MTTSVLILFKWHLQVYLGKLTYFPKDYITILTLFLYTLLSITYCTYYFFNIFSFNMMRLIFIMAKSAYIYLIATWTLKTKKNIENRFDNEVWSYTKQFFSTRWRRVNRYLHFMKNINGNKMEIWIREKQYWH